MLGIAVQKLVRAWRIRRDPVGYARSLGVCVGNDCRLICLTPSTFGSDPYLIRIGNHVTITAGVRFITHDGAVWVFRERYPEIDVVAPIVLGDNVFVGTNAVLMPGITVGNNCVIAAGAVVTRDVADGSVVAGVPARRVKSIEEYWNSVQKRAFHIRSKPLAEKRATWLNHFFPAGQSGKGSARSGLESGNASA